jgi:hypothetical protein
MLRTRKHLRKPQNSAESYELSTSSKCREEIHTTTVFVLATVLLAYSMGNAAALAAWLVGTTKLFLGRPMFLTRYYSHEEHQTQWPTRLLSGAFDSLALVGNVTIGALCRHYSGTSAGAAAGFCLSWYVHGATMRKLGFIEKRDDGTWTDFGPILQDLCFMWDAIVGPSQEGHAAAKQPFTGPTLAIFAYDIVLGTPSLLGVLTAAGVHYVFANCLWGFLTLWLLKKGLLAGAFVMICKVAFSREFDRLMKAAINGYKTLAAVDKAIGLCAKLVAFELLPAHEFDAAALDALRADVNAILVATGLALLPLDASSATTFVAYLQNVRGGVYATYETARRAVVKHLTGNEDGRIVFSAAPTGLLGRIAACYDWALAANAKARELSGIAIQCRCCVLRGPSTSTPSTRRCGDGVPVG